KFEIDGDDVSLFKLLKIRVKSGSGDGGYGTGGKIRISGGEATTEGSVWCEKGKTVNLTLSAEADEGYVFVGWSGVPDADKYNAQTTTEAGADVTAVFRSADGSDPKNYVFVGAAGDAWDDPYNWNDDDGFEGVPVAGDSVTVPNGKSVLLTNSTPRLASLSVAGTVVMTNWTTCLCADAVTVPLGGKITCGAAAKSASDLSRVWIDCGTLTLDSGASIDVNYKGYSGGAVKNERGYGPGSGYFPNGTEEGGTVFYSGSHRMHASPSHGGRGTFFYDVQDATTRNLKAALPYDDPFAPMLPGSGGCASPWTTGMPGGGAVYIVASGCVTVNGTISANAQGVSYYTACPGSGGSVRIVCQTFAGSGTITANGGSGADYAVTGDHSAPPGAGGCISVEYDTSLQVASAVRNMKISAASGQFRTLQAQTITYDYRDWRDPEPGTLHFSDAKIVDTLLGNGLHGQIVGLPTYVRNGNLDMSYGFVRFADEGASVTIDGNLTISGTDIRLDVGGCRVTNATLLAEIYGGTNANRLVVTGDMTIRGRSRFDVRAAEVNGSEAYGAYVTVGGTMTVSTNCKVYAWSDSRTPSSPRFEVGSLHVMTGALFSAARRGGASSLGDDLVGVSAYSAGTRVTADGAGKRMSGAGHGGRGGLGSNEASGWGCAYDDALRPWLPGSGAGGYNEKSVGGRGGGAVVVSATNGTIRIDGTVTADGENANWARSCNNFGCGGSGGTIFLECRHFAGNASGVLSAKGGDTTQSDTTAVGAGGGGRIAVWCGLPYENGYRGRRIVKKHTPLTGEEVAEFFSYEGSYSAAGGTATGDYATEATQGQDGTVWFCYFREKGDGLTVIVR
ncbi:MAG: G8 domain-containing protein, partial [Kiritimatiellae bacterium]|nr:G8 domain-containing protein [Kiritimatiellia bacterium]